MQVAPGEAPVPLEQLRAEFEDATREYERLRAAAPPLRAEVLGLLAIIDRQFDAWLDLLARPARGSERTAEQRALVERGLLQVAVLRSRTLHLELRARPG